MVESAAVDDTNNNKSTIKNRVPHAMGVSLRIVSSHQGTKKKKIYSRIKSKDETAHRRKEQRKEL
jgi:hypothetical protein